MKGDFSRQTFDATRHFLRVLMQQGRVQLDADGNELVAILLHYLQSLAADLIGPHGGPDDSFKIDAIIQNDKLVDLYIDQGHYYVHGILCEIEASPVKIIKVSTVKDGTVEKYKLAEVSALIVDGKEFMKGQWIEIFKEQITPQKLKIIDVDRTNFILKLNDEVNQNLRVTSQLKRKTTYYTQPDYPLDSSKNLLPSFPFLVYLDVWERHLTSVEYPAIQEIALGKPDTTTRTKVIWQVKTQALSNGSTTCKNDNMKPKWMDLISNKTLDQTRGRGWQPENRGLLKISTRRVSAKATSSVCNIPPESRYRGAENQFYRVEVHQRGGATNNPPTVNEPKKETMEATFKWSRENGAVILPIRTLTTTTGASMATTIVTLEHLGRDERFGLNVGDWVEIVDDDYTLQERADSPKEVAPLLQVIFIDPVNLQVTLEGAPQSNVGQDMLKHPLMRRWDHKAGDKDKGGLELKNGAALIKEGICDDCWLDLEDGIQIQFQLDTNDPATYLPGDYWLIPARTSIGDVEWPTQDDGQGKFVSMAQPPHGGTHHFAPLAVVYYDKQIVLSDCRGKFEKIAKYTYPTKQFQAATIAAAAITSKVDTEPLTKTKSKPKAGPSERK